MTVKNPSHTNSNTAPDLTIAELEILAPHTGMTNMKPAGKQTASTLIKMVNGKLKSLSRSLHL